MGRFFSINVPDYSRLRFVGTHNPVADVGNGERGDFGMGCASKAITTNDLIFFQRAHTLRQSQFTHVAEFIGNGMMLHCKSQHSIRPLKYKVIGETILRLWTIWWLNCAVGRLSLAYETN